MEISITFCIRSRWSDGRFPLKSHSRRLFYNFTEYQTAHAPLGNIGILNSFFVPFLWAAHLHLSQALLEALVNLGYTHIRFNVKEMALEWVITDMMEDGNVIRLVPMEKDEFLSRTRNHRRSGTAFKAYRARITASTHYRRRGRWRYGGDSLHDVMVWRGNGLQTEGERKRPLPAGSSDGEPKTARKGEKISPYSSSPK